MKNQITLLSLVFLLFMSCSVNVPEGGLLIDPRMEWFTESKWKKSTDTQMGLRVVVDSHDNNYIYGEYDDKITLGDYTLTDHIKYGHQNFIAKADEKGNWLWAKNINCFFEFKSDTMVIDSNDNFYISAILRDSLLIGEKKIDIHDRGQILVAKFDPDGKLIWVKFVLNTGDDSYVSPLSLALNSENTIYLSGNFSHSAQFGEHNIFGGNKHQGYIATISPDGKWLSAEIIRDEEYDISKINDVIIDNQDNIFITGITEDDVSFIIKLDRNHKQQWLRTIITEGSSEIINVKSDLAGNIFAVGTAWGVTTFGNLTKKIEDDGHHTFVAKIDSMGVFKWVNISTSDGPFFRQNIIVDETGNCFVKGDFYKIMKVGKRKISSKKFFSSKAFLWKINSNGKTTSLKRIGKYSELLILDFSFDSNDDLILTGLFREWGASRGIKWMRENPYLFLAKYKM